MALVVGYGRVGSGVAAALKERGCRTVVYDTNPIRRVQALADGFAVPSREMALSSADVIFGATGACSINGSDFEEIKNGALLISCSSRDVEFDVVHLRTRYRSEDLTEGLQAYYTQGKTMYLVAEGRPVNFLHGAVIGPVLSLVQAEILVAIDTLWEQRNSPGLCSVSEDRRQYLAKEWIETFVNPLSGTSLNA